MTVQILVVNPNTTASMTETIAAAARGVADAGTEVVAVTSSMGPASIEGYYDEALAVPGLLMEIAAGERAGAQAAIIACFDDTGLDAARAMSAIPVIGICEAALSVASFIAQRFTVVTTTERSRSLRAPRQRASRPRSSGAASTWTGLSTRPNSSRSCAWRFRLLRRSRTVIRHVPSTNGASFRASRRRAALSASSVFKSTCWTRSSAADAERK